jgi:hypothetical protein
MKHEGAWSGKGEIYWNSWPYNLILSTKEENPASFGRKDHPSPLSPRPCSTITVEVWFFKGWMIIGAVGWGSGMFFVF